MSLWRLRLCDTRVQRETFFRSSYFVGEDVLCRLSRQSTSLRGISLWKGKGSLKSFLADSFNTSNRIFSFFSPTSSLVCQFGSLTRQRCSSLCVWCRWEMSQCSVGNRPFRNESLPRLSEKCAKDRERERDLFLDRQVILYSYTYHHWGNRSDIYNKAVAEQDHWSEAGWQVRIWG